MNASGYIARFARALLAALLLAAPLVAADVQVDRDHAALQALIRDTPIESIDDKWLVERVYRPFTHPQPLLKRILGDPGLAAKNARMARARQAYDLKFWFWLAREKGWTIELTNQGKDNGHRSDLDQTGWIIAGPEANRPKNFEETQRLWREYHAANGIDPGRPDISLFSGDLFLPDAKNARLAGDAFVTRMAGTVLQLRQDSEAYYVPGANKEQVHKRGLAEGRTLHISWDPELGTGVVNGKPIDLDTFVAGGQRFAYLPASLIAQRYRGVQPDAPWRYALGNLAQNLEKFLSHVGDPIARQKYGNRILDDAFARVLGVTGKDGLGDFRKYYDVHIGKGDARDARAFKEAFVRQLYGEDIGRNRVDELIRIFDISMDIEADKVLGKGEYDPARYYGQYLSEAAANLRRNEPGLKGEELRARSLDEAERIFVQRQLRAYAEGAAKVLAHAVRQDFGPEGRRVNRTEFIGGKAEYEALVKRQAERQVEVALLFEVVERLDDPGLRQGLRNNLIDAAGDSAELRRLFGRFSELGQAGREAVDDWLRASAEQGKLARPEDFYRRVGDRVQRAVGDLDAAATVKAPPETAQRRAHAALATTLGPAIARQRANAAELLSTARGMGKDFGRHYWEEFSNGLNFFFYADTATSLIRDYQQGCVRGGLAGGDCGRHLAKNAASNFFWGLPYIENYGVAAMRVIDIGQGDAGGFFSLTMALAPRLGVGASVIPIYSVYKLVSGVYDISYNFVIQTLDDDLLEQALKSRPSGAGPAQRCGVGGTLNADRPDFPLFGGGKNRIRVEADGWDQATREKVALAEFGPAINHRLLAEKLQPGTPAWYEARRLRIAQTACELPYYQRMAKLYEHLSPQVKTYIDAAAARGRDMEDFAFEAMEACVDRENDERAKLRKAAEAKGGEALEARLREEGELPSPLALCLPRGIDNASAVLRPFMTKQVGDWLGEQRDSYRDAFSTTFELATEGNRIVEDLRRFGRWLGIVEEQGSRDRLMKQLTDTLIREYLLGQYTLEKREQFAREMESRVAAMAAQVALARRVLEARADGERALGEAFVELTARSAGEIHTRPITPIAPTLKLLLPPYPVRLGEDFPIDANVRGEHAGGGAEAPANAWRVAYALTPLDGVREGAPPGLVVTPEVARDLKVAGNVVYTLKASVTARLLDGDERVLAEDRGELTLFDIRPQAGKPTRDAPTPATGANLDDLLDALRAAERAGAEASRAARERCDAGARLARQGEADLRAMQGELGELDAGHRELLAWLERATQAAAVAAEHAHQADAALRAIGDARKRADHAAAEACDGVARMRAAATDSARREVLRGIASAVQRCKAELVAVERDARAAEEAARLCAQARDSLPPSPSTVVAASTNGLQRSGATAEARLVDARAARDQARQRLAEAVSARGRAGELSAEGDRRLRDEPDAQRRKRLGEEMAAILRGMDRARRDAEGCPEQVGAALAKVEEDARALAERAREARERAERTRLAVEQGKPLKDAETACRSARAAADTATLFAASARAMCEDAALCQVIAEDLSRQPTLATVPGVTGLTLDNARAQLARAGLRVGAIVVGDAATDAAAQGRVQSQQPAAGHEIARDSAVELRVWGAPDRAALLAATDCSRFPGSVPVWDARRDTPACACPAGFAVSGDGGRCIDCGEYEARFAAAFNAGNLADAAGWLGAAPNCPWQARASASLSQAEEGRQRFGLDCLTLETNILAALNANNLAGAQGMLAQARAMNCPLDPSTEEFVRWAERNPQPVPMPAPMPWPPQPEPAPSGPVRQVKCNDTAKQGGNKPETLVVDLGAIAGTFRFSYDMYSVPDRMIVRYGGGTYDTGCVGNKQGKGRGVGSVDLRFYGSSQVTVQVLPSCEGGSTSWKFTVHCPR